MPALIVMMILITNNSYYLPIDVGAESHGSDREGVMDFDRGNPGNLPREGP